MNKFLLKWGTILWIICFLGYYGICCIFYTATHTQAEYNALKYEFINDPKSWSLKFAERQLKLLTFQKLR